MGLLDHLKSFLPKRRLDVRSRFVLLREAISGTMSKFYMAKDRNTGEVFGLKILDPKETTAFEIRFQGMHKPSEGEIASRFEHPNIVRTFEYGRTTDDLQYVLMEYVGGPGMNSALLMGEDSLKGKRVKFLRQAAEALAVVHQAGVLHRDICPRNLILTEDGKSLKLIDFGLAIPATEKFLRPGNRTGTPNYMAPELARRQPTDHRVDVFALGVTAYEICTSELPWPKGTSGLAALSHDKPPANIRTYRPTIHPRLAEAIHACIEPDLKKRCPSVEQFGKMLCRVEKEDAD